MKRIIFCVTNDLTYDRRMMRISNALCDKGYLITLVGRELKGCANLTDEKYRQKRISCIFSNGFFFYAEFNIRLFFYLLFSKFDIVGSIDDDTLAACALVKMIRNKKLVFDSHEYFTEVPELEGRSQVKKFWLMIERIFIRKCDLAYTVSESIAKVYTNVYHKKFHTILNCPEIIKTKTRNNFDNKIILYQGALNLGRGLEELIQAMQHIDATLLIAGEGDKSSELRQSVSTLAWGAKIKFLGYIKPSELNEITQTATIGYNVLKSMGLSYQYSLSNKFFDYIQNRVPSLSSDFIEYHNILLHHPVGFTARCEASDIADKINMMLSDASIYNQMVSACDAASLKYNWQTEKQKLVSLYDHL